MTEPGPASSDADRDPVAGWTIKVVEVVPGLYEAHGVGPGGQRVVLARTVIRDDVIPTAHRELRDRASAPARRAAAESRLAARHAAESALDPAWPDRVRALGFGARIEALIVEAKRLADAVPPDAPRMQYAIAGLQQLADEMSSPPDRRRRLTGGMFRFVTDDDFAETVLGRAILSLTDDDVHQSRVDALRDLIELRGSVADMTRQLRSFHWDSEKLVTLTRADAVRLLDRYLAATLSAGECEAWADAIEVRDDVGLELGRERDLRQFVFELANPALEGPLTRDTAEAWRVRLR
jgi:hypothetical protein